MTLPPHLFKYQRVDLNSLVNLLARVVYFGSPKNFNDPYDCAVSAIVQELSEEGLVKLLSKIDAAHIAAIEPNIGKMLSAQARSTLQELAGEFVQKRGVTCFAETNENLLMWSHYAASGTGMCLQFDTSDAIFSKVHCVKYVDSFPAVAADELLVEKNYSRIFELYCTKSKDWSYEREWRAFHETAGTKFGYASSSLVGVYLGPRITNEMANLVAAMLKGYKQHVPLYVSKPSASEFKMEFELAPYGD